MLTSIKRKDLKPVFSKQLLDHGRPGYPIDLMGCSVWFIMTPEGADTPSIQRLAVIDDAVSGRVHYQWLPGDTDAPGNYLAEWEILYPDGTRRTIPEDGYDRVSIVADLGDAGIILPPSVVSPGVLLEGTPAPGEVPIAESPTLAHWGVLSASMLAGMPAGDVVGTTDAQSLSNKTIDGSENTFANVPTSALVGSIPTSMLTGFIATSLLVGTIAAASIAGLLATENGGFGKDVSAANGIATFDNGDASFVPAPAGELVGTTAAQSLSNKSIDGNDNTFANIPTAALVGSIPTSSLFGAIPTAMLSGSIPTSMLTGAFPAASLLGTVSPGLGGLGIDASGSSGLTKFTGGDVSFVTAPAGDVVGTTDAQALTNKVLDGALNTFSNVPPASLSAAVPTSKGGFGASVATANGVPVFTNGALSFADPSTFTPDLSAYVDLSSVQTLTSKTLDGASNTFANIPKTAITGAPAGAFVGTTDAQALSNKTIDASLNTLSNVPTSALVGTIPTASLTGSIPTSSLTGAIDASVNAISNIPKAAIVGAPAGAFVGTTDAQALTNKTIDASLNTLSNVPLGALAGLAAGVSTFLATPSSANLATALTDKTGTGANVFATSPALVTPNIGVATGTTLALGTNPALSGTFRLPSGGSIVQRNSGNTADVNLIATTSTLITIGSSVLQVKISANNSLIATFNSTSVSFAGGISANPAGLGTTGVGGVTVATATASSAGTPVQYSPRISQKGRAWNSAISSDETQEFLWEVRPATAAGTTTANFVLMHFLNSGFPLDLLTISDAGVLSLLGSMVLPTAGATPANPPAGSVAVWFNGTNLKAKDSAGNPVTWA
jgi:hypothetical protein